jgi:hypothetical protein
MFAAYMQNPPPIRRSIPREVLKRDPLADYKIEVENHIKRLTAERQSALSSVCAPDDLPVFNIAPQSACKALAQAVAETQAKVQAEELLQREVANPMSIEWLLQDIKELQRGQEERKELEAQQQEEDEQQLQEENARFLEDLKTTEKLKRRRARETMARCKGRNDQWEERRKSMRDRKLNDGEDQMRKMMRLEAERKIKSAKLAYKRRLATGMPAHLLANIALEHEQEIAGLQPPTDEEMEQMRIAKEAELVRLHALREENRKLALQKRKDRAKAHALHLKQAKFQREVKGYSKAMEEMQEIKATVMPRLQERALRPGQVNNPMRNLVVAISLGDSPAAFLTTKAAKHGKGELAEWAKNVQYRFLHRCQRVGRSKKRKREEKLPFLAGRVLDDFRDFCRRFPGCRRRGAAPLNFGTEGEKHPVVHIHKLVKADFRLLHAVIEFTITLTGFGEGVFDEDEQNVETFFQNVKRLAKREQDAAELLMLRARTSYLSKIIACIELYRGRPCNVSAKRMARGRHPGRTLNFLRILFEVGSSVYDEETSA